VEKYLQLVIGIVLAFGVSGCQPTNAGITAADIRFRVFELQRDATDPIFDISDATPVPNSPYSMVMVTATALTELMLELPHEESKYVDRTSTISMWPKMASTWTYAQADEDLTLSGGGAGFLGTRIRNGVREVRIDYDVLHDTSAGTLPSAKITYEGPAPDSDALVFFRSYNRADGTDFIYFIAFESMNWR